MNSIRFCCAVITMVWLAAAQAVPQVATMRGQTNLDEEAKAPLMGQVDNRDIRRMRAYPMQPSIVPHRVDGYQVDLRANKCMSCHARSRTRESQATMVSVTHYMDRDGNFLATISPRRYFCSQCHVSQEMVQPPVANEFLDVDQVVVQSQSQ